MICLGAREIGVHGHRTAEAETEPHFTNPTKSTEQSFTATAWPMLGWSRKKVEKNQYILETSLCLTFYT